MKKYLYILVIVILSFLLGLVNSSPVPHSSIVLYNWCSLFGIGYVAWHTIEAWK